MKLRIQGVWYSSNVVEVYKAKYIKANVIIQHVYCAFSDVVNLCSR